MTEKNIKGSVAAYKANCTRRVMRAMSESEEKEIRAEYDKKIKNFLKENNAWNGKKAKRKVATCGQSSCRISRGSSLVAAVSYEVYSVRNGERVYLGKMDYNPMR